MICCGFRTCELISGSLSFNQHPLAILWIDTNSYPTYLFVGVLDLGYFPLCLSSHPNQKSVMTPDLPWTTWTKQRLSWRLLHWLVWRVTSFDSTRYWMCLSELAGFYDARLFVWLVSIAAGFFQLLLPSSMCWNSMWFECKVGLHYFFYFAQLSFHSLFVFLIRVSAWTVASFCESMNELEPGNSYVWCSTLEPQAFSCHNCLYLIVDFGLGRLVSLCLHYNFQWSLPVLDSTAEPGFSSSWLVAKSYTGLPYFLWIDHPYFKYLRSLQSNWSWLHATTVCCAPSSSTSTACLCCSSWILCSLNSGKCLLEQTFDLCCHLTQKLGVCLGGLLDWKFGLFIDLRICHHLSSFGFGSSTQRVFALHYRFRLPALKTCSLSPESHWSGVNQFSIRCYYFIFLSFLFYKIINSL